MAFVNGQEYVGKNGKTGTWNAQTGCFHVVENEVSVKYTAADFIDTPVVATPLPEVDQQD